MQEVQTKAGLNKVKRIVTVTDESEMTVQLCLWEEMVHRFDKMEEPNSVVVIQGAKIIDYSGRQINVNEETVL